MTLLPNYSDRPGGRSVGCALQLLRDLLNRCGLRAPPATAAGPAAATAVYICVCV